MKNVKIIIFIIVGIIVVATGWFVFMPERATTFSQDTLVEGDFAVAKREKIVLADGARLQVKGNLEIDGELDCKNGGLRLEVEGDFTLRGSLKCEVGADAVAGEGIAIVVSKNVLFSEDSAVETDGSIQIVTSPGELIESEEEMDKAFEEIASEECEGVCAGPFLPEKEAEDKSAKVTTSRSANAVMFSKGDSLWNLPFVSIVSAATPDVAIIDRDTARVSGYWKVNPPERKRRSIVLLRLPYPNMQLSNLTMDLPDGKKGDSDKGSSCNRYGTDGKFAGRLSIWASRSIRVNNFTLNLGNGGEGGSATTADDCYPKAIAKGGNGGESGNLKMIAGEAITIEGTFKIVPGKGGNGGFARASAADAPGPGAPGGDAEATGGIGHDNKKRFSVQGAVSGVNNVQIDSIIGGSGGEASAFAGDGGDGNPCRDGGRGGYATAKGGKGGDVKLAFSGSAASAAADAPGFEDKGGNGGDVTAIAGNGGKGGDCDCAVPASKGGDGGRGGDAGATPGTKGTGDPSGEDGEIIQKPGGNGGDGGSITDKGVGSGVGGKSGEGGDGIPPGKAGEDGKDNVCPVAIRKVPDKTIGGGSFEFLDVLSGKLADEILVPGQTHFVAATDGTPDVRDYLPIQFILKSGSDTVVWSTYIDNRDTDCRGATGCSVDGPQLSSDYSGKPLRLEARGKNNELIAEHDQPAKRISLEDEKVSQPESDSVLPDMSETGSGMPENEDDAFVPAPSGEPQKGGGILGWVFDIWRSLIVSIKNRVPAGEPAPPDDKTANVPADALIFGPEGFFAIEMPDDLGTHKVGESFIVPVTIYSRNQYSYTTNFGNKNAPLQERVRTLMRADDDITNLASDDDPRIGSGTFEASPVLSPGRISQQPPRGPMKQNNLALEVEFTCMRPGEALILYKTPVFYEYTDESAQEYAAGGIRKSAYNGSATLLEEAVARCVNSEGDEAGFKPVDSSRGGRITNLQTDLKTQCGGSVAISGAIDGDLKRIKKLYLNTGKAVVDADFNTATGAFNISLSLHPGKYDYWLKVDYIDGTDGFLKYGKYIIDPCGDEGATPSVDRPIDQLPQSPAADAAPTAPPSPTVKKDSPPVKPVDDTPPTVLSSPSPSPSPATESSSNEGSTADKSYSVRILHECSVSEGRNANGKFEANLKAGLLVPSVSGLYSEINPVETAKGVCEKEGDKIPVCVDPRDGKQRKVLYYWHEGSYLGSVLVSSLNSLVKNNMATMNGQRPCASSEIAPVSGAPLGWFEIYDTSTWQQVNGIPVPGQTHFVAATDGTPDVRDYLPIQFILKSGSDTVVWSTYIDNRDTDCRGATGCSVDGPQLSSDYSGKPLRLEARGKNNELIAEHDQ